MNCFRFGMVFGTSLIGMVLATGCVTNIHGPDSAPQPTSVKLSTFQAVTLHEVTLAPEFVGSRSNEKARKKINELLSEKLRLVLPKLVAATDAATMSSTRPLVEIKPQIEKIKFIGGAARFWVGPLAGSSAVLMKVSFVNTATGETIGSPEFYCSAAAMAGAGSFGVADNVMLERVATQIADYVRLNQ